MVLVSYILYNYISSLQTKFRDREGHEARRIRLEAVPLDQHIEGGHGEGEPGVKIRPDPVHDFLEVTDECQHREHRLHQHPVLPLTPSTQFEVGGIALRRMEGGITQDNHPLFELLNEPLKSVIRDIRGGTVPRHDEPPLIQHETQFAPDNPPVIREAFAADLLGTAAFAHGVDQLDPV